MDMETSIIIMFTNSKMSKITFSDNVQVLNNGTTEKTSFESKKVKRKKTPFIKCRNIPQMYCQTKAHCVANRIESEVKNPHRLEKRQHEEMMAEKLLVQHQFYTKINKVYRLTDTALGILTRKLSFRHGIH